MKEKMIKMLTLSIMTGLLVACSPQSKDLGESDKKEQNISANQVVHEEIIEKDVPRELKQLRAKVRKGRGYLFYEKDGAMYLYMAMGEKPTGGYGLDILSIERDEDTTDVFIAEKAPEKGMMVTQVISYPTMFLKIEGTTRNIRVIVPDKGLFGQELKNLKR